MFIHTFVLICVALAASGVCWLYWERLQNSDDFMREANSKQFRYVAVADDAGSCSTIGTDIMIRQNGSTTEAAIAVAFCAAICNPHSTGLVGDLIMNIYDKPRGKSEKELMTLMARVSAPLAATEDMFVGNDKANAGGMYFGVPGFVKGLHAAWLRYGRIPWANLVNPTIDILRKGVPVHRVLVITFAKFDSKLRADDNLRSIFTKPDGSYYKVNERIKNPKLLKTLQAIAENPLSMYERNNPLMKEYLADVADYGGITTEEDMISIKPRFETPIKVTLNNGGLDIYAPSAPSGGPVLLHILKILDGYNFTADSVSTVEKKILTYHRIIEAFKFGYGQRTGLGDPVFSQDGQVEKLIDKMLSSDFSESRRLKIDDDVTHDVEYYEPEFEQRSDEGTSHTCLMGLDGTAVSFTTSINSYFGAGKLGTRTGILFGDVMDDFSVPGTKDSYNMPASPVNFPGPQKMPQSSIAPFIALDSRGVARFVGGASGGIFIPSAVALVIANKIWFNRTLDAAVGTSRFHHQLVPNEIKLELEFDQFFKGNQKLISALKKKGHRIKPNGSFSVAQAIYNNCESNEVCFRRAPCIQAVSDGRKVGVPDGV